MIKRLYFLFWILAATSVFSPVTMAESSIDNNGDIQKSLKLKIAIGRFSNETNYGRSLLRDSDLDPLGKQASDILSSMLTETNKFLIFERPDLTKIQREQDNQDTTVGVDTLILGSIVEFGRNATGKRGLFNRKKQQKAHAKVTLRLVDVKTGHVFHSATGRGEAVLDSKTVIGIGSTAEYDATLNDKAISAAINSMINDLISSLQSRKWRAEIIHVEAGQIYISGGKSQGLVQGDELTVFVKGKTVVNKVTGVAIPLPSKEIAKVRIVGLFGETELTEGSIAEVVSGSINGQAIENIYVAE